MDLFSFILEIIWGDEPQQQREFDGNLWLRNLLSIATPTLTHWIHVLSPRNQHGAVWHHCWETCQVSYSKSISRKGQSKGGEFCGDLDWETSCPLPFPLSCTVFIHCHYWIRPDLFHNVIVEGSAKFQNQLGGWVTVAAVSLMDFYDWETYYVCFCFHPHTLYSSLITMKMDIVLFQNNIFYGFSKVHTWNPLGGWATLAAVFFLGSKNKYFNRQIASGAHI